MEHHPILPVIAYFLYFGCSWETVNKAGKTASDILLEKGCPKDVMETLDATAARWKRWIVGANGCMGRGGGCVEPALFRLSCPHKATYCACQKCFVFKELKCGCDDEDVGPIQPLEPKKEQEAPKNNEVPPKEAAPKDPTTVVPSKVAPPKENPSKEAPPKENPLKETPPKENPPKEAPPKEDPPKDAAKENPPKEKANPEEEEKDSGVEEERVIQPRLAIKGENQKAEDAAAAAPIKFSYSTNYSFNWVDDGHQHGFIEDQLGHTYTWNQAKPRMDGGIGYKCIHLWEKRCTAVVRRFVTGDDEDMMYLEKPHSHPMQNKRKLNAGNLTLFFLSWN